MFTNVLDICNVVAQNLGVPRVGATGENSKMWLEFQAIYDKIRQDELRAHVWRFACRKAALRAIVATTKLITFPAYVATTTYQKGDIVSDTTANAGVSGTALYISLIAANVGNTPSSATKFSQTWAPYFGPISAEPYDATHTYSTGELVWVTTNTYLSTANGNIANTPPAATWTAAALTGATNATLFIEYPITQFNSGATRTAYQLPYGYLRVAPQDPKAAGVSHQVSGAGMQWSDYQFEGEYLLSSTAPAVATLGPLLFRFVADIADVTRMEPLFARSLCARVAFELCETMTQKPELKKDLGAMYDRFVAEAKQVNLIESGTSDPLDADFPLSRLPGADRTHGATVNTGHTVNMGG